MKIINNILFKNCLIIFLLLGNSLIAQTSIQGIVKDSINNPISYANILIKPINSDIVTAYTHSETDGSYKLNINKIGLFEITYAAISYKSEIKTIYFEDGKNIIKNITLKDETIELNEVIIEKENAIIIKPDTIVFNAKDFSQGNEQVVEDLLKKIPGISISNDGVIKIGGQEVEKVMIEGDDFFEKGYKLLTKNMPANPIEKVELYQHYSNNKHLKGVENSDKVALNLKLKDDAKREWFGNLQLGYGLVSENRYDVRINLMNFGKKNKYYFLSNLNNVGADAVGDIDHLIRPAHNDEPASIGDNQNAKSVLEINNDIPNLNQNRINLNNSEMVSLNSIFIISPKTKIKTLGFFYSDENDYFKNSLQTYSIGSTSFENKQDYFAEKVKANGFGKVDLTYDISKSKTLEYTGKISTTNEKSNSDLMFNSNLLNEKLQSNNHLFDQKIVFTNKFKENKVFILSARYINEKTPQIYSANQFIYQTLFNQNANNINQSSENKMQFAGFEAHLLNRKKSNDLLEIRFGNQFRYDNLTTNFQLKINEIIIDEPINYQNKTIYSVDDLYLNSKYRFKFNKIYLLTQADFHQIFNSIQNSEKIKNQNVFFINPKIGFEWEVNKKNKLTTSFSINTKNATILDVNNNYIQNSFRSFSKGIDSFNQLNLSTIILNHTYGNWGDKFFSNAFFLYSKNHDFLSTNTTINQNYSQSEKIIIKDRDFLTLSTNIDRYFKIISANLKLTLDATKSNYKNIVNNSELRKVTNSSIGYGIELRSGFKRLFSYNIGTKWNYNEINTTISNSYSDNTSFLDLSFMLNDKLNIEIDTERYYFGNLDNQNNKYTFMDLKANYAAKKNKLIFSVLGNNLFNTKTFKNYNITDISISKTEYRFRPRYVLLKMEFRF